MLQKHVTRVFTSDHKHTLKTKMHPENTHTHFSVIVDMTMAHTQLWYFHGVFKKLALLVSIPSDSVASHMLRTNNHPVSNHSESAF